MLCQDEIPISDASAQTRQPGGVLTPVSDNSPNSRDSGLHGGKKRKRDGNTMEDLLKDPFVIRPYPSIVSARPRALHPLVLLLRSQLPLSSLDTLSSTGPLPQSRLFETHVKILELEERMGSQPMLLIARLDDGRTLYAVEREDRGLYVICQLGSWVNLTQLRAAAVASIVESPKSLEKDLREKESAAVPLITPEVSKYSKKKRLAIEAIQSMVKRPSIGLLAESQPSTVDPEPLAPSQPEYPLGEYVANEGSTPLTAAEVFENVRNQYLEALYSKASLAYFTKGPLSRARAAFHLDYDSTLDMNDYIAFLESLIMTTKLIDKKYIDGVPAYVSLIDVGDHSADDANQNTEKAKKRRGIKKMKPGKDGLYPMEDILIARWWTNLDDDVESGMPGASRAERTKHRTAQLRVRETQLQMIVILEVLALQPLASTTEDLGPGLPATLPTSAGADGKGKSATAQKPNYLTMLIDFHIDRLCIWQDIAAEASRTHPTDTPNSSESGNGASNVSNYTDNILRDFCVDVIGPFFSARLPDRCTTINSRLGGPVVASPPKPKFSKSAPFSGSTSRPGAATKRPVPTKSRHSLKRVLSDERERERRSTAHGRGRSMSLMRSLTAPIILGLKREASEAPSLSSISAAETQSLKANRPGVLASKRFSHREVDLSSLAPEVNSKAKKQANIDAELKDAIAALKKPNRELAGKNIVETAEKRTASASHSRKSKKPVRNTLFLGVQISATPKMNRQKDMFSQAQHSTLSEMVEEVAMASIPPPSHPRIPQSVARPSREGPGRSPLVSAVHATPSRKSIPPSSRSSGSLLGVPPVDYGGSMLSSPLQPRRLSGQLFTAVPDSALKTGPRSTSTRGIEETEANRDAPQAHGRSSTPASSSDKENGKGRTAASTDGGRQNAASSQEDIYRSLGWDDADDFDELS